MGLICGFQRWKARHTVICGKKGFFDGTGVKLIGKYLLRLFLMLFDVLEIDEMELTSEYIESSINVEEKYSVDQHNTKDTLNIIITAIN